MKKMIQTLIITSALCGAFSASAEIKPINSIAVTVNSTAITYAEVQRVVKELRAQAGNQDIPTETLVQNAKMTLVERALLVGAAHQMSLKATPEEVNTEIKRLADSEKISVAQLYRQFQLKGMSAEAFRLEVAKNLVIERMFRRLTDEITIKEEQINQYIDQARQTGQALPNGSPFTVYTIRRLLLNAGSQENMPAVGERMVQIAQAVKQGTPFESVVRRYSQEAVQNGVLDVADGMLPFDAEALLHQMKIGDVSTPIASGNTWQMFQLLNTRTENQPEKMQREAVRRLLLRQEQQKAQQQFIMQLQQNAVINEY